MGEQWAPLFDAQAVAETQTVFIAFDECRDSGQLKKIIGLDAENAEVPLPEEKTKLRELQIG